MLGRSAAGGRSANTRGGRGGRTVDGRGGGYSKSVRTVKVGLCKDLEGNIFDFGTKTLADLMRTTQEKIVQYVGTKFGADIANELQNRVTCVIPPPPHTHR